MIRRSRLVAPAALAAALLLSACGGGGADGSSGGSAGGSATDDGPASLSQASFFSRTASAQSGAGATFHLSGKGGEGQQAATFTGDVKGAKTPADTEFAMTVKVSSTNFKLRLVDQKLYLNPGEEAGDKYFVLDPTDTSNPITKQFSQLFTSFDPAQQIANAKKAIVGFEAGKETETIDGVETRPYTLTVDTRKALELAAQGQDIPEEVGAKLPKTVTTEVWVGTDDRPRRIKSSILDQSFVVDFSKWGEPVTIEKPAASEISNENPFASAA